MTADKIIRDIMAATNEVHEPLARHAQQAGALQQALRNVYAEYTGENMKPEHGAEWHRSSFGDAEVLIEYDYEPAEEPVYNIDSPTCGPGCPASVSIICVLINGKWVDGGEFPMSRLERWGQEIIDGKIEAAWEDQEERLAERGYP